MDRFEEQLHAASKHPQTRDDLVKLYSTQYGDAWKQRLAEDIQPYTRGRNGQPQSIRTIRRRFEDRYGVHWYNKPPSPAAQAQYKALGETIDQVPEDGYRGNIEAVIWISRTRHARSWKFHVRGAAAEALLHGNLAVLTQAYGAGRKEGEAFSLDDLDPRADFTEGYDYANVYLEG